MVLEGLIGILALGGGAALVWAWRLSRRLAEADRVRNALFADTPVGLVCLDDAEAITLNGAAGSLLGLTRGSGTDSRAGLFAAFAPASVRRLTDAMAEPALPVTLTLESSRGAILAATLQRAADGTWLLWLNDETAVADLADRYASADRKLSDLKAVVMSMPLPLWWRGPDQGLAGINAAMGDALEMDAAEALRQRREFHPDARAIAQRAARDGVAHSESRHVVVRGERLLFEIIEQPVDGRPGETVGIALDRTALEEVSRALERHLASHADVLERLSTAIAIYGPDQRLQFHNHAFREIWGLGETELDDAPGYGQVLELLRERRHLPEIIDFRAFVRGQEALFTSLLEPAEELVHLPDERTIRVTVAPHPMGGLLFLYEDVTDRLQLERSRNTLAQVQQATLNQLREGVAVFGSDGRLRLWNPVFARLWNFDAQSLDTAPHIADLADRVRPLMSTRSTDQWLKLKQAMVLSVTEQDERATRIERSDNMVLDIAAMPLPDGQRLLLFVDVTASVAVERALEDRNQALERTEKLKSEFIGHVSYALRSPLNSILGFAELLHAGAAGPLAPRQSGYVADILAAAGDLSALVSDILDQAAIDAGYMQMNFALVDSERLVSGVVGQHQPRARDLEIALSFALAEPPGPIVADGARLRQALDKLIANALDVTRKGGKVSVFIHREGGGIAIAVEDTGPELPAGSEFRLFERFERRPGGDIGRSGLYLSLAKGIAELHRGRISGKPGKDGGARIELWLPNDPTAEN